MAFAIDLRGLDRVRAKLQTVDSSLLRPWRAAVDHAGDILVQSGAERAPGSIGTHFVKKLDAQPIPRFVRAEIRPVPANEGERYPYILNAGQAGARTFHYRSGKYSGRATKGWIPAALKWAQVRIGPLLRAVAAGIEQAWER